jgi:hypothetical protein
VEISFTCWKTAVIQLEIPAQVNFFKASCEVAGKDRDVNEKIAVIIALREGGSVGCIIFSSLRR